MPQTFSTPTLLEKHGDERWGRQRDAGRDAPTYFTDVGDIWKTVQDVGCPSRAQVYFGTDTLDVLHAHHVADRSTCVTLHQYDTRHSTGVEQHASFSKDLKDAGILSDLLRAAVPEAFWNATTLAIEKGAT